MRRKEKPVYYSSVVVKGGTVGVRGETKDEKQVASRITSERRI